MSYQHKYLFGIIGLVIVLHSFLLNTKAVDMLLDPATDSDAYVIQSPQSAVQYTPIAYFHCHNPYIKLPAAPMQHGNKHHSKHKSTKHNTGFKCMLDRFEMAYTTPVRHSRDIHTAAKATYHYAYFREINPPPPKLA